MVVEFIFYGVAFFGIAMLTCKLLFDDDWWSGFNREDKGKEDDYFNKK